MQHDGDVPCAERARFERLYRTHYHQVLGYALRRVDAREDAGDVVADTFLVAWRRLAAVPEGDALPWLYGVARRVLANQRRARRRRVRLAARLGAELATALADMASPAEPLTESALSAAFARLGEADREVLALEAWEGLRGDGIAAVLGCTPGAARVRLHRARRRLAAALSAADLDRPAPAAPPAALPPATVTACPDGATGRTP